MVKEAETQLRRDSVQKMFINYYYDKTIAPVKAKEETPITTKGTTYTTGGNNDDKAQAHQQEEFAELYSDGIQEYD
jgi:hypothetical protein